jgi:hypothetical protein
MCAATTSFNQRYNVATLQRAERAVRCAPFAPQLYINMIRTSVSIKTLTGVTGVRSGYTNRALSELRAETELLWLMQVGLLRREVDGQGLTDSFRITPLGRQLIERWQQSGEAVGGPTDIPTDRSASGRDRLYNALCRWLRLPF